MAATYIALEGPDGVGKSTVAAALKERLLRRTRPDHTPSYSTVRIRHFPTGVLTQCAGLDGYRLKAEDYAMDMVNWLSFRPEPVLFPDAPTHSAAPRAAQPETGTLYILDRWALSTAVYASLRSEGIPENVALTLNWLNRVPLATFVLLPRDPALLTDPDYGADNGTEDDYDPVAVTEVYRRLVGCAPGGRTLVPVVVDRARDTPGSVAADIVERLTIRGAL